MANENQYSPRPLGIASQQGRAVSDLGNTARRRCQRIAVHHLNRIHHHDLRFMFIGCGENRVHVGFRHELQRIGCKAQTLGTHGYLLGRFFPGDVQRRGSCCEGAERL